MGLTAGAVGGLGNSVRTKRTTTGSVAGGGSVDVTVTWAPAFADANYTATVSVLEGAAGSTLRIRKVLSQTAAAIVVRVFNEDTLNTFTGTVHALAIHD